MYQPYPTGTQIPEIQRPPIPPQVTRKPVIFKENNR